MPVPDYIRDPAEIYRRSFAAIRAETDLSRFSRDEAPIAVRVVHACGMPDVAANLVFHGDPAGKARAAVAAGRPIYCDVEMVRAAIIRGRLPASADLRCTLNDAAVAPLAKRLGTTRSAAAVQLWKAGLEDAVVVIGNAPTALFALLEMIDAGCARPSAVFAFPVGFVGAVESKAELAANPRGLDVVTLTGRRGGSAIAGAAFNGVFAGGEEA